MAKRKLIIWCTAMVIALCSLGVGAQGCTDTCSKESAGEDVLLVRTPLMDSYYCMERDSSGAFVDSVLDTIPGLVHKECEHYWSWYPDRIRFKISIGIYLDEQFPNELVRETILTKVDSIIPSTFEYDLHSAQVEALKNREISKQSTHDFLDSWERVFDELTRLNGYGPQDEHFNEIFDTRGCTVCHKIYDDAEWATYALTFNCSFHASCGAHCYVDYFTIDKRTGKVLAVDEVIAQYGRSKIGAMLVSAYRCKALIRNNYAGGYTGDELISNADGVAIINEGILVYYHPYRIGNGAEGQYNLIITP